MCRVISNAHLRGAEKGKPVYDLEEIVDELAGHAVVLTGCRKGAVRQALLTQGPTAAWSEVHRLVEWFGRPNVMVELIDHGYPLDTTHNDLLAAIAADLEVGVIASNNVHYAQPHNGRLAAAVAAVRARRSLEELDGWLPPAPTAFVRTGAEMGRRFRRYPGAVQRAALLGLECAFDLKLVAPDLPPFPVPEGHTEITWLRHLVADGAARRYGSRDADPKAYAQLNHELGVIEELNFPGYFLVVWDIVEFCRHKQHPRPGPRVRGELRGLLRAGDHQRRPRQMGPAVRTILGPGTRRATRHRRRHRVRPPRRSHPVRLRQARPPPRRPSRERDHLPRPVRRP